MTPELYTSSRLETSCELEDCGSTDDLLAADVRVTAAGPNEERVLASPGRPLTPRVGKLRQLRVRSEQPRLTRQRSGRCGPGHRAIRGPSRDAMYGGS